MMMNDMASDGAGPARPMGVNFRGGTSFEVSQVAITPEVKVRKEFPESWIYENFNDSGLVRKCQAVFLCCVFCCFGTNFLLPAQFYVFTIVTKLFY